MTALLHGLPLQPEESDRCELMDAKSELFLKYFTLFMNLINNCKESSEEKDVVSRQRDSKLATLRDTTIQAMSNLLSANIDSGLRHSISTKEYRIFIYAFDTASGKSLSFEETIEKQIPLLDTNALRNSLNKEILQLSFH